MPYPTKEEFVELLRARRRRDLVDDYLGQAVPFAFESEPLVYELLRNTLAETFALTAADITVIGSGRIGFSLDPSRFGAPYSSASDIDTVIVSSDLFDTAWIQMCAVGRRYLEERVKQSLKEHRTNNIFYGFVQPERLPGVVGISQYWFRAFKSLARVPELSPLNIQGRLYRTWDHVKLHQLYSLNGIANKLKA
jgi:hypothetical protein